MDAYVPIDRDEAVNLLSEGLTVARSRNIFDLQGQASLLVDGLAALGYVFCAMEPMETGDD